MIETIIYKLKVHRVLRKLAKQRVAIVLQPGNIWVVDRAVPDDEVTDSILKTCFMRGWVEPLQDSVPKGQLNPDGSLPDQVLLDRVGPLWKLTDSGWAAIHRSHQLAIFGLFLSLIGVLLAIST
jgi:hypothetical protein